MLGLEVRDAQQTLLNAREIKNIDEIVLLNQAAAMVDGVYHQIFEELKPGVRKADIVASATKRLYEMDSDQVEAINAVSGERCNLHPHNFTDRLFRPGDQAFFDVIQSYMGYRTCYYRTINVGRASDPQRDAYKQAREWIDASIELIRPGVGTDEVAKSWPTAGALGFANEMECFGLQFGHGRGLFLHERPIISRLVSLENPMEIKEGMVFALEIYCPAADGFSGARIEEEVFVTDKGCRVITLFPSEELPVAKQYQQIPSRGNHLRRRICSKQMRSPPAGCYPLKNPAGSLWRGFVDNLFIVSRSMQFLAHFADRIFDHLVGTGFVEIFADQLDRRLDGEAGGHLAHFT